MIELIGAVVVTVLFSAAGIFAAWRAGGSRRTVVRIDYGLHVFMAAVMTVMAWVALSAGWSEMLAIGFVVAAAWFAWYAAARGRTVRFEAVAAYHGFMMATMALMLMEMRPPGDEGHAGMASRHGMSSASHHAMSSAGILGDLLFIVGTCLAAAAVLWLALAVRGARSAVPRRHLTQCRLYEFAMATGMAVMAISHG